jgi:hypothetical protein
MDSLAAGGTQVLIPPDAGKRKGARPSWQGGHYEWMRRVLATELGERLYRKRSHTVEPMFGPTKHNRGMRRLQRRGRSAARTEWRLITATHNSSSSTATTGRPRRRESGGAKGPRRHRNRPARHRSRSSAAFRDSLRRREQSAIRPPTEGVTFPTTPSGD